MAQRGELSIEQLSCRSMKFYRQRVKTLTHHNFGTYGFLKEIKRQPSYPFNLSIRKKHNSDCIGENNT